MAVWTDKFIRPNSYSRPQNRLTAVRKIVMHWTANYGATANGHYNYFNTLTGRYASAHLFVDKNEALCIIPLNEISYHANDGTYKGVAELKPNANYLSIGIEMCVEKDGSFHPNTIAQSEDVAVELCKRYKLDPMTDIVRHYDITRKSCPTPWVNNSAPFVAFKKAVASKMGKPSTVTVDTTPLLSNGDTGSYVKEMQQLLAKKDYKIEADGIFGDGTEKIVREFQAKEKLEADGYVGDATWKALRFVPVTVAVKQQAELRPAVQPVSNPKPVVKPKSHTVEKGETFYSIADKYDMSVADLQKFNPRVNASKLQVGDVIYLYSVPTPKPVVKPVAKPVAKPVEKTIGNVVIEASTLNIRSGADLDSKVVGEAKKGSKFAVYEQKNGMLRIGVGKWISAHEKYSKYTPVSVAKYHTVKSGDTVSELAVKYGSTVAQIKTWNKLDSKYTLDLGQKLRVK